eukprot:m.47813 g.47813  ORF g.47813 m.47813 type:complete len:56 (-) comp13245_c0_seq1:327-494(-)
MCLVNLASSHQTSCHKHHLLPDVAKLATRSKMARTLLASWFASSNWALRSRSACC